MPTIDISTPDSRSIAWSVDYCGRCNPLAQYADRQLRLDSLTEPISVNYRGGKYVICEYECACGHRWTRSDLWTAEQAGFDPKRWAA